MDRFVGLEIAMSLMLVLCLLFSAPEQEKQAVDTLIVGGHVFETESGKFVSNSGIAIKEGRFVKTNAVPDQFEAKETVMLGDDKYLLPGLIDCHAHYNVKLIKKRREEFAVMPVIYLANGATVTFSCGEFDPEEMFKLRKRIEQGKQLGPRLLNSGPYFGRARPGWRGKKDAQEIRDEVDFWASKGVGGFKAKAIGPDALKVLIEQAHTHNLTVTGHLDSGFRNSVNPRDAIEMGIDRIEHFLGGDAMPASKSAYASLQSIKSGTEEWNQIVQHFIKNKTVFDATLTAYGYLGIKPGVREEYGYWIDETQFFTPYFKELIKDRKPMKGLELYQRIYDAKLKTIADFHKAGGTISLGTDHVSNGNHLPGFGVHRELDALVRSGISEAEAIRIGTINGARALRIDKDHGSIEAGKFADLVVVTGNPLDKICNTRNVVTVFKQGVGHDAKQLLNSVKGKLGPSSKEEEKDW